MNESFHFTSVLIMLHSVLVVVCCLIVLAGFSSVVFSVAPFESNII